MSPRQRSSQSRKPKPGGAPNAPNAPHASGDAAAPARFQFHEERLNVLMGVLGGVLLAVAWWHPSGAYPIQSLALGLAMLLLGAALAVAGQRGKGTWKTLAAAPGPVPAARLAMAALAAYALARWRLAPVHALGRDWAVGLCWMAAIAPAGAALARRGGGAAGVGLRRVMAAMAIALGMLACWQYGVGYRQTAQALGASLKGPVSDLETQSLLFILNARRVAGRMGNPNLFAAQLAVAAIFAIGTLGERRRLWRLVGAAAWLAAAGALALTGSRGGALTFAAATALAALTLWMGRPGRPRSGANAKTDAGQSPRASVAVAAIAGTLALAAAVTARAAANVAAPGASEGGLLARLARMDTVRERLFYWSIAIKIWASNLPFGVGPGGFERLYPLYKSPLAHESQYAHSWIFQYGAELGLVGVALIAIVWAGAARGWWRTARMARALAPIDFGAEAGARANDNSNSNYNSNYNYNDNDSNDYSNDPVNAAALALAAAREARWPLLAVAVLGLNGLVEFALQWRVFLIAVGALAGLGFALLQLAERAAPAPPKENAPASRSPRPHAPALGWLLGALTGVAMAGAAWVGVPYDLATEAAWQGQTAAEAHDWATAIARHREALRWEPDDARQMVALAGDMASTGQPQEAWDLLLRARAVNPGSASVRAAQAKWLEQAERLAEALAKWSEAVAIYPTKVDYRLDRARLLLSMGRLPDARADLQVIERGGWPVWEFQREPYNALRRRAGLAPLAFPGK